MCPRCSRLARRASSLRRGSTCADDVRVPDRPQRRGGPLLRRSDAVPRLPWVLRQYADEPLDSARAHTSASWATDSAGGGRAAQFRKRHAEWEDTTGEVPPSTMGLTFVGRRHLALPPPLQPLAATTKRCRTAASTSPTVSSIRCPRSGVASGGGSDTGVKELVPELFYPRGAYNVNASRSAPRRRAARRAAAVGTRLRLALCAVDASSARECMPPATSPGGSTPCSAACAGRGGGRRSQRLLLLYVRRRRRPVGAARGVARRPPLPDRPLWPVARTAVAERPHPKRLLRPLGVHTSRPRRLALLPPARCAPSLRRAAPPSPRSPSPPAAPAVALGSRAPRARRVAPAALGLPRRPSASSRPNRAAPPPPPSSRTASPPRRSPRSPSPPTAPSSPSATPAAASAAGASRARRRRRRRRRRAASARSARAAAAAAGGRRRRCAGG